MPRLLPLLVLARLALATDDRVEVIANDATVVSAESYAESFSQSYAGSYAESYAPAADLQSHEPAITYAPSDLIASAGDVLSGEASSVTFDLGVREALMEGAKLVMTGPAFNEHKQEYLAEAVAATMAVEPSHVMLTFQAADQTGQQHINNRWEAAKGVDVTMYVVATHDAATEKGELERMLAALKADTFLEDLQRTLSLIQNIGGDVAKIDPTSIAFSSHRCAFPGFLLRVYFCPY